MKDNKNNLYHNSFVISHLKIFYLLLLLLLPLFITAHKSNHPNDICSDSLTAQCYIAPLLLLTLGCEDYQERFNKSCAPKTSPCYWWWLTSLFVLVFRLCFEHFKEILARSQATIGAIDCSPSFSAWRLTSSSMLNYWRGRNGSGSTTSPNAYFFGGQRWSSNCCQVRYEE